MLSHTEILAYAKRIPDELTVRIIRTNAKFDALCEAEGKLGRSNTLSAMQDALMNEFVDQWNEVITLFPEIENEQPTADGEYLNSENLQRYLRNL